MPEVLVCLDFADVAAPVLDSAAELATALHARLHLLHVAAEEPELAGYDRDPIATYTREDRARQLLDEHHELRGRADELTAQGLEVVPHLVMGSTVEKVLDVADDLDASYIVVGSHHHGGLHHLLLGSVSEGLARKSHRPLVLVPVQRR